VTRLAGLDDSGDGGGWRVFLSHTSELREFPRGMSYGATAERAVSAAGHVIVDMADFPAASQPPAQLCADRVRGCDAYEGVLGTRYGFPVRDKPEVSYTELGSGGSNPLSSSEFLQVKDLSSAPRPQLARCVSDLGARAIWERILFWEPSCSASRASRTGTIERGASRARSRSEAAKRSCNAVVSSARMAGLTWLWTPRMPGTSWPIRSDFDPYAWKTRTGHYSAGHRVVRCRLASGSRGRCTRRCRSPGRWVHFWDHATAWYLEREELSEGTSSPRNIGQLSQPVRNPRYPAGLGRRSRVTAKDDSGQYRFLVQ
jgi:Domain of unknown function (DUF4062)